MQVSVISRVWDNICAECAPRPPAISHLWPGSTNFVWNTGMWSLSRASVTVRLGEFCVGYWPLYAGAYLCLCISSLNAASCLSVSCMQGCLSVPRRKFVCVLGTGLSVCWVQTCFLLRAGLSVCRVQAWLHTECRPVCLLSKCLSECRIVGVFSACLSMWVVQVCLCAYPPVCMPVCVHACLCAWCISVSVSCACLCVCWCIPVCVLHECLSVCWVKPVCVLGAHWIQACRCVGCT
jgi:hypothetical protein